MEIANEPNLMGKPFLGSLLTHAALIALLVSAGLFHNPATWGSPRSSTGSVGVNIVKSIPIPHREGPLNPLANDTKSVVPQAPPVVKQQKIVEAPPKNAIPIPSKTEKPKKPPPREQPRAMYVPPVQYKTNQLYAHTPQATTSAMYGMRGSGGIDLGPASVFGSRFGAYANLLMDRISQHWNTADVIASPTQKCAVTFTLARNGTVSNVQITRPSGNLLLDNSAKRALLDSNPLPPLPTEFTRDEATVELEFQMKQ